MRYNLSSGLSLAATRSVCAAVSPFPVPGRCPFSPSVGEALMVGKVWTIGWNAFRETVRQPVFCVVLGIAGGLIALSPTFSMFTLLESERLVKDMGLSTMLVAGLLLAVLSASNVVSEEVRGRTALMVVSRPVGRWAFVGGKFLGLALAQLLALYLLGLVLVMTVRIGVPEAVYSKIDTRLMWGEIGGTALALALAGAVNYFFDRPFPSSVVFWAAVLLTAVVLVFGFFDRDGQVAPWLSAYDGQTVRACVALAPLVLVLNNGTKIKLLGLKELPGKKREALQFLKEKTAGQKVFLKFDSRKYDQERNLVCYLFLKNKTFLNAHLVKNGLAAVDDSVDFKYKSRFEKLSSQNETNV